MAGESLSLSELQDWYSKFDAVVTNYGGGALSTLGVPDGGQAVPSDINNLYNQITAFRNDKYFKTQPQLYASDYSIVSSGTVIKRSDVTPIINTVANLPQIKCRNDAVNSKGSKTHGTKGNQPYSVANTYTQCQQGVKSNVYKSHQGYGYSCVDGSNKNGTKSNGSNSHIVCSYGEKSNGSKTHLKHNHTTVIDILNALGTKSNG